MRPRYRHSRVRSRIADPRHFVSIGPAVDEHGLEYPSAVSLHAEVVPIPDSKDEIRPVIDVVLNDRKVGLDARSFALPRDEEMVRQVLAPEPPARTVVPELFEGAAYFLAPLELPLPQMVQIAVLGKTRQHSLDVPCVYAPRVFGKQLIMSSRSSTENFAFESGMAAPLSIS